MLPILVCHSYFSRLDPKQLERAKPYPPLATLHVAALLRAQGHAVHLFDAMLAEPEDFEPRLREIRPRLLVLYEDHYNFLTKMCLGRMRRAACEMIRIARRLEARVIVSSSDASDDPQPYLNAGADAVLLGEGLVALAQLAARLDRHPTADCRELVAGVPGIASLEGATEDHAETRVVMSGGPSPPPLAPDPPIAAWDLVDIERYRSVWRSAHGFFSLNLAASRGCSFRCAWCAKPIWGNRYLQRDAHEVAAELGYLKRHFAPDHIWFADDIFGFRVDWVQAFAAAVRAHGGPVPFTIQTRADLVSARMAAALADAGCREAWLGAESGSQRILDAMRKGLRVGDLVAARELLAVEGIRVGFFIQLGYPGEALADLLATRELIESAAPDEIGVSVAYPLPGTAFFEHVKAELGAKTHWRDSGELAMMFHGTYSTGFYHAVRDLLHAHVEARRHQATDGERYRRTRHALDARWDALLAREREFRHEPGPEGHAVYG
jgi:anaerobic magnesium-protoporphyrin IX monomethyl ester cyclase